MTRKNLLSIDGGGIRGIITLCALAELEAQLKKPSREVFSYMSGTSTGAIILAGLAKGLSALEILEIYKKLGSEVFRLDVLGFLFSLGSFRYRSKPLHDRLVEILGNPILNDLPIDVMFTSMRVRDGRPFYFVRDNPNNAKNTGRLRLADCVTASASAPTFFEPWDVPGVGECVDGGLTIAGNPCYQMCVEAFEYSLPGTYTPSTSTVIALGTGFYDAPRGRPGSLIGWLRFTLGQLLNEPAEQQTQLVQRHFVPHGARIFRWNPPLPRDIDLDKVDEIPTLLALGKAAAAELDWHKILAEGGMIAQRAPQTRLPRNVMD